MPRIPEGREILQCTVNTETVDLLKVKAAMTRITVGQLIDQLVQQTFNRAQIVDDWRDGLTPHKLSEGELKDELKAISVFFGGKRKARTAKDSGKAQETRVADGEGMTWADLKTALATMGKGSQARLSAVVETNVSVWAKTGRVPSKHVAKVREFLLGSAAQNGGVES